jgi:GntR family transcriptional regulator, transcriptional repressor for pyruvate dehydrogenase complex
LQTRTENGLAQQLTLLFRQQGLKAGDRLPGEIELAGLLNVSRPSLREAMGVLEAAGLVGVRKGSGRVLQAFNFARAMGMVARHAAPEGKWLLDLLSVRQLLENNMLSVAAAQFSAEDYSELDSIVREMEDKAAAGKYFGEDDRRFHLKLYQNLNNEILNGILELFWNMYGQLEVGTLAHSQRLDETAAHHRRILASLEAGDVRRAQHHLDSHFYDTGFALSQEAGKRPAAPT